MNPLISIVVPTFNSEKYLDECFSSICKQSYENLEVIVVDGGSDDKSRDIAKAYINNFSNWKLLVTEKGVSHQRNVGKDSCNGDYIFFLDSDDYINNSFIEDLYSKLVTNKLDLITPSINSVDYKDFELVKQTLLKPDIINFVSEKNFFEKEYDSFLAGPTKLYKSEDIKDILFDETLSYGEDLLFNYELVKRRPIKFDICNSAIYYYRHDINITNPLSKRMNKSGYLFCLKMLKIVKGLDKNTNNFTGAFNLLKLHVVLYIKEFINRHRIIPLCLLKPRLYLFAHTKRKFKFYYLIPRVFNFAAKIKKRLNNFKTK